MTSKDITGRRFGNLVALHPTDKRLRGCVVWDCICDCGNHKLVSSESLLSGNTKSCGCLKSQGNRKVRAILDELGIEYKPEYRIYTNGSHYSYDFAVLDGGRIKCFIEYDGVLHYEPDRVHGWNNMNNWAKTKKNDEIKTRYAADHGIPLIRIPYTDYKDLTKEYITERIDV